MSKAYSMDLRDRVIKYFELKMKQAEISKKLDISISTVERYASIYKKQDHLVLKKEIKTGRNPKISATIRFCTNPNSTIG